MSRRRTQIYGDFIKEIEGFRRDRPTLLDLPDCSRAPSLCGIAVERVLNLQQAP